jgi:anti-sigma regulatory factor (Ser/Thr protein kinase)
MCWTRSRELDCDPVAVTRGRRLVVADLAEALDPAGPDATLVDDAALVVTELLSNAVRAGGSRIVVRLEVHHRTVRVEVFDDGAGRPVPRRATAGDVGGRGLHIVDTLSAAWGAVPSGPGKRVWSELPRRAAAAVPLSCDRAAAA